MKAADMQFDLWGVGLIALRLLTGRPYLVMDDSDNLDVTEMLRVALYKGVDEEYLQKHVMKNADSSLKPSEKQAAVQLIKRLLAPEKADRPQSVQQVLPIDPLAHARTAGR